MDFRLELLAEYLKERFQEHEKLSGQPLGDETLKFKMLCNSTPGVIGVFVGRSQPDESQVSVVDIWYDFENFYERTADHTWKVFNDYREEFTSTILDVSDMENVIEGPVALEIVGPEELEKDVANPTTTYYANVIFSTGDKFKVSEVSWSLDTQESGVKITKDPLTGNLILDYTLLAYTTTVTLKAKFTLTNGEYISSEKTIKITVVPANQNIYHLRINGPSIVRYGQSLRYTATLSVDLPDGSTMETDVTTVSSWMLSVPSLGTIDSNGNFVANTTDQSGTVIATYTIDGQILTATLNIYVTGKTAVGISIQGLDQIRENSQTEYRVQISYDDGSTEVWENDGTHTIEWSLDDLTIGTIENGIFSAPYVNQDTNQIIKARINFNGTDLTAEKSVLILNVTAPYLDIVGPNLLEEGTTAQYQAKLSVDGTSSFVTADWTVSPSNLGTIDANGNFTAVEVDANQTVTIQASHTYLGYPLSATKSVTIKNVLPFPVSLEISGPSEIEGGDQAQYLATVTMSDGTSKQVTPVWSTDNSNQTIDQQGVLTATNVANDIFINIRADYSENGGSVFGTLRVRIKKPSELWAPYSLVINGPNVVDEGSTNYYTADVIERSTLGNTRTRLNVPVTWVVDNYGTIDNTGKFIAALVNANAQAVISAIYNDGINLPVTASLPITINNVPLLVSLSLSVDPTSIYGGFTSTIQAMLTKRTGYFDVTNSPYITYTSSDPTVTVNKTSGKVSTQPTSTTKTVTITATYTEAGETVTASTPLEIRANLANTLVIYPASATVFEGSTIQFNAALTLSDGTTISVTPNWTVSNASAATIDSSGLFTANQVNADVDVNVSATYSGTETGGTTIGSNIATVTIKNIIPTSLTIFNESNLYKVNEGDTLSVKTRVTFNDGSVKIPTSHVTYSLSTVDEAYATLTTSNGICTIRPNDLTADKIITLTATYAPPDYPQGVSGTKQIQLLYVRSVVGLQLSIENGPYYGENTYQLTLREKYDDGTLGNVITSGITWSDTSAFGTIDANNRITFFTVSNNTPFSITATYNNMTSNTVSGIITNIAPVAITIISTQGMTIRRGQQTTLLASITLSDGSTVNPSSQYPITWTLLDPAAGTLVTNADYTATFTAANRTTDLSFNIMASIEEVSTVETFLLDGYPVPTNAVLSGPSQVPAGTSADYTLTVNFDDGSKVIVSPSQTQHTANFSTNLSGCTINNYGRFQAGTTLGTGTISASYTDNISGVTVTATPLTVQIKSNVSLVISAATTSLFEKQTDQFTATLSLADGSTRPVNPTWIVSDTSVATIDANGLLTAKEVSADTTITVSATYSGPETSGNTLTSNVITLTVKNIVPTNLMIINDNNIYSVNKGSSLDLKTKVTFNDGSTLIPTDYITYTLSSSDSNLADLTVNNGIATITPKNTLTTTRSILLNAKYAPPDYPQGVTATKSIQLIYVKNVVELQLDIVSGPYYGGHSYQLTVREKYDDGTYGSPITSGITWSDTSAFGTINSSNKIVFNDVSADAPFSITATYNGRTSNTVSGTVLALAPASISIQSSNGTTIKRGNTTTLSATITLNDGVTVNPSSRFPINWTLLTPAAGTLVQNPDYTATFTAADLTTDMAFTVKAECGNVSATKNMMVDGYPIPVSATLTGPTTVNTNSVSNYTLTVTFDDNSTININPSQTQYAASFSTTLTGSTINNYGRLQAGNVPTTGTISASYTDPVSKVTVTATPLTVTIIVQMSLVISAATTSLFEKQTDQFTATLYLTDGSSKTVTPTWIVSDTSVATIDSTGLLTAKEVSADKTVNVSATYSGPETSGNTLTSNVITLTIKNIIPTILIIFNDDGIYSVNKGSSLNLKTKATFNDNSELIPTDNVTYTLGTSDSNYAYLDVNNGVATITPKSALLADRTITVTAKYAPPDYPQGVTATKSIQLIYVKSVVGVQLDIASGPYYAGHAYQLTVREKYDDGTYGSPITSGITWSDTSAFGTINSSNKIVFNDVLADTPFSITATYNERTSDPVTGVVLALAPASITIQSSNGTTIKRGNDTTLSATITLNDGTTVNPSSRFPITWEITPTNAGTLEQNPDYTAIFTAGELTTDLNFTVKATSGNVTATQNMTVDGYPIPISATLSGSETVDTNSTADYTLTVTFDDNSTIEIKPGQTQYSADFSTDLPDCTINTYGKLTTGATAGTGTISASYTDSISGVTVTAAPINVEVKVSEAPVTTDFTDAVYVGTVGRSMALNPDGTSSGLPTGTVSAFTSNNISNIISYNSDPTKRPLFEAWLASWLKTDDPYNSGHKYLEKKADKTKLFPATPATLRRGNNPAVAYPQDNYTAALVLWPQFRNNEGRLQSDSVPTFDSISAQSNLAPMGTINLKVYDPDQGQVVDMPFNLYIYDLTLGANASATIYFRCVP